MVQALKAGSKGLMPLDQWKRSPEFRACTDKQQRWLLAVIETDGDYTAATLAAYGSKNARQAQIFSYAVRDVARVKAALDIYLGKMPLDVLLDDVNRNLRRAEKGSVAASRLLAQKERLLGLAPVRDDDEPEAPEAPAPADPRIPDDALKVWVDRNNVVIGFRDANGQDVRL